MIQNPILRGFCPDPSIIRAGEDYYIATSTFEWWPGVKLFHSRDLKNWEQLPSLLRRKEQLNLLGDPPSGGVWAPCLSYDGSCFYLVYTDVKTKKGRWYNTHNYMVYTKDIRSEWSEPVYLNSIGFDPSLFHDRDGKKYLLNMVNGFKGVLVQELCHTAAGWRLTGERKKIYDGSGIGCTEGPHMYHIGDWYYLMVAEGGTGYEHCVTLARSESIWGPFETAPDNPILTSDRSDPHALQKCGHADLTDTPDGEWYLVHLCSRPLNGQKWCTLGRETAIQKLCLSGDGWFSLQQGGKFAQLQVPEPEKNGARGQDADGKGRTKNGRMQEDFDGKTLPAVFSSPRASYERFTDLLSRPGWLRIRGEESMNSLHHVSLVAVRQQEICACAETIMDFAPDYSQQLAGLAYLYDAMNFYIFGETVTQQGQRVLTLLKSDTGVITDEIEPVAVREHSDIALRAKLSEDGMEVSFYYAFLEKEREAGAAKAQPCWQRAGGAYTTWIVTDEYCRGFTGAHFGLYAHDMTGLGYCADFDCFTVRTFSGEEQ